MTVSRDGAQLQHRTHEAIPGLGEALVFVVGCPRSGTTWTQRLLAGHPRVHIGQESLVFSNYVGRDLRSFRAEQRRELHPGKAAGRGGKGLSAHLLEEEFLARLKAYSDSLLQPMMADLEPGDIYVDKTCAHARFIPEIKQLYPAARFVNVLRDPRDVTASWIAASRGWGRGWATPSVKAPVQNWIAHVGAVRDADRWLHNWDFYEIVYERLSADPALVLGELTRFLGLSWSVDEINEAVLANSASSLRDGKGSRIPVGGEVARRTARDEVAEPPGFVGTATPGGWRSQLSSVQKVAVWYRARHAMRRERYGWHWRDFMASRPAPSEPLRDGGGHASGAPLPGELVSG